MKNLFKNNVKTIAATALAAIVTVSMSFTTPKTIDMKTNEINSHTNENELSKTPIAIPNTVKIQNRITTIFTKLVGGKNLDQNNGSLDERTQLKLSQLDQQ